MIPVSIDPRAANTHEKLTNKIVELAIIFLRSTSDLPTAATGNNATTSTNTRRTGKSHPHLNAEISPAMTRVHECRRADTGVGPSIASGSHRAENTATDFMVKMRKIKMPIVPLGPDQKFSDVHSPASTTRIARSPHLFHDIAAPADLAAELLSDQCPMSLKEMKPIASQKIRTAKNVLVATNIQTEKKKTRSFMQNSVVPLSNSTYREKSQRAKMFNKQV